MSSDLEKGFDYNPDSLGNFFLNEFLFGDNRKILDIAKCIYRIKWKQIKGSIIYQYEKAADAAPKMIFIWGDAELMPLSNPCRKRETPDVPYEEQERRALLQKRWARHRFQEHVKETHLIKALLGVQQRALQELRDESEELYQQAVERDSNLFPFQANGPVHTPPIPGYTKDSPGWGVPWRFQAV